MSSISLNPVFAAVQERNLRTKTACSQVVKVENSASNSAEMTYCIEPLSDPRWDVFLSQHSRASVFHSSTWLAALSRTYGYKPVAFTTSPSGHDLKNAVVFCRVESWLTGRRLVSLPFSDHCEPLVDHEDDLRVLTSTLEREAKRERWRYIELRPLCPLSLETSLRDTHVTYTFHQLDLQPDLDALFRGLHKSSTQRKIRRAQREGLTYREGRTQDLLEQFYALKKGARVKHKLPPQPLEWFSNLVVLFGDDLKIRVAYKNELPIAAMLTIRYKDTLVYKYGGSDSRFNNLGGMHLLFWNAIQDAKSNGLRFFDLGRTDEHQHGLINFKSRWGTTQSALVYKRYGFFQKASHAFDLPSSKKKTNMAKYVLSHLHPSMLSLIGRILYRHVG